MDSVDVRKKEAQTGADAVLTGLKRCGVDYLFANAGTDFPPIIEGLSSLDPDLVPTPVTVAHETAAVAMAHGYYLVTGRMQAVMVHVNVGLANAAMGAINAASDNVPLLLMSGRTPITEQGRPGGKATPIQYGQEMYDQTSIVRDIVKYSYEMRYPEQGDDLVIRAAALAGSEPKGPVYLSLPREPLTEVLPASYKPARFAPASTPAAPEPAAISQLADWLEAARNPVILCQRGDTEGKLGSALSRFAERFGVSVCEPFSVRNVLASADASLIGYDPVAATQKADLVIVLDSAVPWIEAICQPGESCRVAHIGPDPHFIRNPSRGYRVDLAICSDAVLAIDALGQAAQVPADAQARKQRNEQTALARRKQAGSLAMAGATAPMSAEWMSRCISQVMDADAVAFSELGLLAPFMDIAGQNRFFNNPHSGGLGWAFPAALGAQLANRKRLTIAVMGDGSYMFANPVACHQIAEALELPVLVIVKNNAMWNAVRRSVVRAYPEGAAARSNRMPLTSLEPLPDFCAIAAASRSHCETVEHGNDLSGALQRAIRIIRNERRQVLLDLRVAVSDNY